TIDQGDLTSPYSLEPAPNGARVNQGFDGNTPNAHTSANPLLQVLSPNGNEKYEIDGTYTITWREVGIPGSGNHVVIELIQGQTVITQIAPPTTLDTGSFLWHVIDDGTIALDEMYQVRVRSVEAPSAVGVSVSPFMITNNGNLFFINDSSTTDDVFTHAPGDDANSGKSPDKPLKT